VQLLSRPLHRQIFPAGSAEVPEVTSDALSLCRSHLATHGLEPAQASVLPETGFELPPLQGKDLGEHFWNVGREVAQPWLGMAHTLAASELPLMPQGIASGDVSAQKHDDGLDVSDWLALDPHLRDEVHVQTPHWLRRPGWTRYPLLRSADGTASALGTGEPVEYPLESDGSLVFDVETMVQSSHFAVMATAASSGAWYAWLSPWLLGEGEGHDRVDHLIPFGPAHEEAGASLRPARLLIGHNIGYDRARIRDEYSLTRGPIRFLDTMALHVATRGISSPQRPAWMKHAKARAAKRTAQRAEADRIEKLQRESFAKLFGETADEDDLAAITFPEESAEDDAVAHAAASEEAADARANDLWLDLTSKNSLADVAELHCGIHMSKQLRNVFVEATSRQEILDELEPLLHYCARDVEVTHAVFRKVWPAFVEHCPHPATAAGVLGLGNAILPVDDEWLDYQTRSEAKYREAHDEVSRCLLELAETLRADGTSGVTWDDAMLAASSRARLLEAGTLPAAERFEVERNERERPKMPWESNSWSAQLDWTPKRPKAPRPSAREDADEVPPGFRRVPQWYKAGVLAKSAKLGARSSLTPALLQLQLDGGAIFKDGDSGWILRRPGAEDELLGQSPLSQTILLKKQRWAEMESGAGDAGQEVLRGLRSGAADNDMVRDLLSQQADSLVRAWADTPEGCSGQAPSDAHPALQGLDWTAVEVREELDQTATGTAPKDSWWPKWYWDMVKSGTCEVEVTIRSKIAPLLLHISWQGCPLYHSREHGWVFRHDSALLPSFTTRQKAVAFTHEADAALRHDLETHPSATFYKVPHAAGDDSNVGSPFSKGFVPFFEQDTLRSEHPDETSKAAARAALAMNAQCSYWIGVRDRVAKQMVVWDGEGGAKMGIDAGASGARQDDEAEKLRRKGLILPPVITMGTVTRRAIEKTWLTASNAKANRVGSELKAMVKAPPGWSIVGADVDSEELWICSVMGDAQFGIHGATAVGWMTLEGTKANGTDLHSKTASILGTSRNQAKVFNYSRIYGAGIRHATQLLLKADPSMAAEEATKLAKDLYAKTKGSNTHKTDYFGRRFWFGGTESFVFNKLEEVAISENPRTPALDCGITAALSKQHLPKAQGNSGRGADDFMPSRINWVVQSSGVDYLHLLVVSMDHLCQRYGIAARFMLSVHDEVRYLARDEDAHRAALALQIANLWTRSMFAFKLEMDDLPQSVAFFAQVDLDKVLRKEADDPCVTPSQPRPIPLGSALNIEQTLEKTGGSLSAGDALSHAPLPTPAPADADPALSSSAYPPYVPSDQKHRCVGQRGTLFLQAQAAEDINEVRVLERRASDARHEAWQDQQAKGASKRGAKSPPRRSAPPKTNRRPRVARPQTSVPTAAFSTSARASRPASESPLPEAIQSIVAAFPARPARLRKPFFRLPSHAHMIRWQLYRPLLRACPPELPEFAAMVRGLTRAKRRCTSPAQTQALIDRGQEVSHCGGSCACQHADSYSRAAAARSVRPRTRRRCRGTSRDGAPACRARREASASPMGKRGGPILREHACRPLSAPSLISSRSAL
jgi:DNA polymerase gamma 1